MRATTITYSKAEGPAWLTVAANGTLSGTPTFADEGSHQFMIYATDSAGASVYAVLTIQLPSVSGNGTWTTDANGNWSEISKWTSSFPANGTNNTANYTSLNITADRTVTLDASRIIGNLQFGDTTGTQNWTLAAANGRTLTLAVASGSPSIAVNQNTATITASLDSTAGFTKSGAGTLVLKGENPLSGTLYVDVNAGVNGGIVRLAGLNAGTSLTGIQIRNNNAGYSTLELDGSLAAISTPSTAPVSLSARSGIVPAIRNTAGNNTLGGALTIQSGGGNYYFQSDGGTLNLDGAFTSAATGSRTLTFQGAGNININGVISNGSATTGIGIVKNDTGTLSLTANNTHTGPMAINGGTVTLSGAGTRTEVAVSMAAGTTLNLNRTIALTGSVAGSGTINNTGSDTITADFSSFTGSYTHNSSVVSTAFNSTTATSKNASYNLASTQGSFQGFIAGANGDQTLELGSLTGVAGSLFRGGNTATGTTTLKVGNLNTSDTFAGDITNGVTKTIAFTKVGTGTMTLSGANTYTGITTLSAGKLLVSGSISASPITVAAGAILGGSGNIASASVSGRLAPGNSAGTLTASGSVTITGTWENEIDGSTSDLLNLGGTLTLTGSTLDFNVLAGGTTQALYTIASYGSLAGSPTVIDLPFGYTLNTNYNSLKQIALVRTSPPFAIWANNYSLTGNAALATSDPDSDGIANSIEYLLGSSPIAPGTSKLPTAVRAENTFIFTFIFTFTRNKAAALEFSGVVESTSSLTDATWTPCDPGNISIQDNGPTETVTASIPIAPGTARLFARLKVQ